MGEKGPVGELGLVLEPDPVPGFMVPHCMQIENDLQYLPGLIMGKLAFHDGGNYPGI